MSEREPEADRLLMIEVARGSVSALEMLMQKWERPLFSFVYRYTQNEHATRDVVQETFVRLYTKREKYDAKYPLASWLFTIAANLCKNQARWRRRHPETSLELPSSEARGEGRSLLDTYVADDSAPSGALESLEDLAALREAVMTLPHDLRTTVLLHHYEGMPYKDIAEVVGCSARGVETRLYRARKILRKRLEAALRGDGAAQKKRLSPLNSELPDSAAAWARTAG